jgi:hypothetical protein
VSPAEASKLGEALARRTRAAQKLPRTVQSLPVARKVAALIVNGKAATP